MESLRYAEATADAVHDLPRRPVAGPTGAVVRVAVADDHTIVRESLASLLALDPGLDVVGQAACGVDAVEVVRHAAPDVLILDVDMPGQDVLTTVRAVRTERPDTSVLILSLDDEPELVRALLGLGVRGYLLKSVSHAELVAAIRSVRADPGRLVLSVSGRSVRASAVPNPLSEREVAVLRLAADALTNRQIGAELALAESTVKRHLHSGFVKLGAVSRLDAVTKAVERGIIAARPARQRFA